MPWTQAAAAANAIIKQAQVNMFSQIQVGENLRMRACEMYISTGKYTVNGQNEKAPIKPKTLLKTGNIIAITQVIIT